jgi:DNA-binding NtrC family response regulator
VGGVKTRRANVRLVCATNRQLLGAPWFRSDLYYRVACMSVRLPSLSERRSDLPLLAVALLERIGQASEHRFTIDPAALDLLAAHDFPGNVRELRNVLWVASVNCADGHITRAHLAAALPVPTERVSRAPAQLTRPGLPLGAQPQRPSLRPAWDAESLDTVLRRHRGNRRAAARELGVSERTVYRKLREFGLD